MCAKRNRCEEFGPLLLDFQRRPVAANTVRGPVRSHLPKLRNKTAAKIDIETASPLVGRTSINQ
jgi:hypothetical protein